MEHCWKDHAALPKNKCLSTGTRHVTPLAPQKSEAGVDHEGVKKSVYQATNCSQATKVSVSQATKFQCDVSA
jgi:hypothetical protein